MTHKHDENEKQITITYDPESKKTSKSGKTYSLASSGGFVWDGDIGISYNIVKRVK